MKKTLLIGITGGIAAFKTCQLISNLKKKDYDIHVIMSKNATKFITPLTLETLSSNKVSIDMFEEKTNYDVEHISLAKKADLFIIVPATANVIGKIANGIADDMLTTIFLASVCHKIICPAMNTNMLNNPITQNNIRKCKEYGIEFIDSCSGLLACGDIGDGKLADLSIVEDRIESVFVAKSLKGKKILISAGPTMEKIDPVRFISNHSSGKMGYALAKAARNMGADVTLVSGKTYIDDVYSVNKISVTSAKEMFDKIMNIYHDFDCIIMASAVSDYTVEKYTNHKIKKSGDLSINLKRTDDILLNLGKVKSKNQILIGFAMETENLIENAKEKLDKKNCDYIIANNLNEIGAGFQADTNIVTIVSKEKIKKLDKMSKLDVSYNILKYCLRGEE